MMSQDNNSRFQERLTLGSAVMILSSSNSQEIPTFGLSISQDNMSITLLEKDWLQEIIDYRKDTSDEKK